MSEPSLKRLLILILVVVPVAAWFIVKPVRVIAPSWADMNCPSPQVCVDDPSRLDSAVALYEDGVRFVSEQVTPLQGRPRVLFCAHQACAAHFGLGKRAAVTVGTFGTIIGPEAWEAHFVRHELIHFLQAEKLGTIRLAFKPRWFVEGMAYELSRDAQFDITGASENDRRQFAEWGRQVDPSQFWATAKEL